MIVVDASALLEVLLRTPAAVELDALLFAPGETLHAPHLLDLEVLQVARHYRRAGALSQARARELVADLRRFPVERYGHEPLLERVWVLRANASAYDAAYLALAEALGALLVTRDAALASVPGHHVPVRVVAD